MKQHMFLVLLAWLNGASVDSVLLGSRNLNNREQRSDDSISGMEFFGWDGHLITDFNDPRLDFKKCETKCFEELMCVAFTFYIANDGHEIKLHCLMYEGRHKKPQKKTLPEGVKTKFRSGSVDKPFLKPNFCTSETRINLDHSWLIASGLSDYSVHYNPDKHSEAADLQKRARYVVDTGELYEVKSHKDIPCLVTMETDRAMGNGLTETASGSLIVEKLIGLGKTSQYFRIEHLGNRLRFWSLVKPNRSLQVVIPDCKINHPNSKSYGLKFRPVSERCDFAKSGKNDIFSHADP